MNRTDRLLAILLELQAKRWRRAAGVYCRVIAEVQECHAQRTRDA